MSHETRILCGYRFGIGTRIEPEREANGRVRKCMPQARYAKAGEKRLNRHGSGPFCRFSIRGLPPTPGVYALMVGGEVVYIGKAANLAQRWGPGGYGTISPANCFEGGQPTNCKNNHGILLASQADRIVELWANEDTDSARVEGWLISCLRPPWNSL